MTHPCSCDSCAMRWICVLIATLALGLLAVVPAGVAAARTLDRPVLGTAATHDGRGYWEVASDGGVFNFGDASFFGSMGGKALNAPIVGMAATPEGNGYWEAASDGGIFSFGDAPFLGSMGGKPLNAAIVGVAATSDGQGYWEVASDGGVFGFGSAPFLGSMGGKPLNAAIVGMVATPDGNGYWEVAADGGVFGFGDAPFLGSMGGRQLRSPIVGMVADSDVGGYWEVASDGGIFSFGDAVFAGSMGNQYLNAPIVAMARTPDGKGYWEVASDGGVFSFGDAEYAGSMPSLAPTGPPRIALYGDSLGMEAGQDFAYLAGASGASTLVHTYGGLAPCDFLPSMASDAASWRPTAVILEFSGDAFTPCMDGETFATPQYYQKYEADIQTAIDIFRPYGAEVILIGLPFDASAADNQNVANLNQLYGSVAAANVGVTYVDAGQAVMANGSFTWTLPCLPREPCTGLSGTNVVRSPDGSHFCPTGQTTVVGYLAVCNVYSSGAYRFAAAMLGPALDS
jgi:hypothetical protein